MADIGTPKSAVEQAYWNGVHAIEEAQQLQETVSKALEDEWCPPHFAGIWKVHVKPDMINAIIQNLEQTIQTPSTSEKDLEFKLALIEMFLTSKLTTPGEAEERISASLHYFPGFELAAGGKPLLKLIKGKRA